LNNIRSFAIASAKECRIRVVDLCYPVLFNEAPLFAFDGFFADSADDGLRFSEEHGGLPKVA